MKDVPASVSRLKGALRGLDSPVWVMVESSSMAPFVKDCIDGLVDRVDSMRDS